MSSDLTPQPRGPAITRPAKNTILVAGVLVATAFLAGFVPSYIKRKGLEGELNQARAENRLSRLRDLAGLAYLQANQKNYGLAAETSTRFFQKVREVANQTPDSGTKKAVEDLLGSRERITSELAKGDAAVATELQTLFLQTRQATGSETQ